MKRLILCGGLAVGKSTLAKILMIYGAKIIEVDELTRTYFARHKEGIQLYQTLLELCELEKEKKIDVNDLRQAIFTHLPARTLLASKLLPALSELIEGALENEHNAPYALIVLPLWPKELAHFYQALKGQLVLLSSAPSLQLKRLEAREQGGAKSNRALIELNERWLKELTPMADLSFINDGALDQLINFAESLNREMSR
jgi:dephospho-CoA kinase